MVKVEVTELWAVVDIAGYIMWTRGGSSTASRMMIYPSLKQADVGLKRQDRKGWVQNIWNIGD